MPSVSKVAKLPAEHRAWLHDAMVKRAFGDITGLTEELNALCKESGIAITFGKSAIGEESKRVKRAQETIAASTKAMKLIAETARDDIDARGEAVNALISTDLFECLLMARESDAIDDPTDRLAVLNKAALAAARLTTSSVRQRKFRSEVEASVRNAAVDVAKLAKASGVSPEGVREIKMRVLGITKRPAVAPTGGQ